MSKVKNIVILGAGESGVGAAMLAQKEGFAVFVSDAGQIAEVYKKRLNEEGIAYEEGGHSKQRILETADLIIKSPGIPDHIDFIQELKEKGIELIDELEFASRYTKAKIIAITGSNGKTTTTRLIHHILAVAGLDVGIAGNIGFSLAKQIAQKDCAFYVVEVSSFQLDNMTTFNPAIAVLLNITPDHLDRYDYKLEQYIASKFRIVQNDHAEQVFIYNKADHNIQYGFEHYYKGEERALIPVSIGKEEQETEWLTVPEIAFKMPISALTIKGRHNYFNIHCAIRAANKMGISNETIMEGLRTFENEPHRLESVIVLNEVEYINDSKATNVDAVYYALEAMDKPIVWIVGGIDKGNDYTSLFALVKEKVRAIVCLGKDNSLIQKAFEPIHEIIVESRSMGEALKIASLYAEPGDAVLLAPACSSFDLFENYKARGNQFKDLLFEQHKIMTEGIQVNLTLNINMNPVDHQSDN
ncbi:UDP-N-acetylmuramoyl-L-alanine--D-glutamate ligase [Aureispira anguillae]|uniref:UDP-N-acetylmuramoylalanine--D-glutamate ligase n=1 Tax=Aureispira anguillae TaxID=2864201 RepID=A0A915YGR5_9BACT|nr:UDP-N-acetylmuramoyl-L-alanine--D-glutamate ligase [Aureispira anguillae]BDS12854.1 UDP-N-acetylmuramoyl-L-alanine--D-glutamate ligase [Aureispira anguillae]